MEVDEPNDDGSSSKKNQETIINILPEEPLLGSITTNALDKDEKGLQIRTSARVFKKMKLEQEMDKKNEESVNSEESEFSGQGVNASVLENENKGQPVRSSSRVVKKTKSESVNTNFQEGKSKKDDTRKVVRANWSYEEKLMFFEAVNQFGKDFENIQQYINNKLKKKGASEEQIKTKENVRQFFNRTFHEVSKHVKFSDRVKKVVQELYGVINYGEMYKKLGAITEKAYMKLNELIYRGATCIRIKGKNIRVKTPMCRALIKLNQLDEKYENVQLPNRVSVEVRPKDMTSFLRVQCIAQNPRLRTTLPIQKRLSSLIQCLHKRWKSLDALNYEKSITSTNPITNDCVPSKEEIDEKIKMLSQPLRITPPPDAKIEIPSINLGDYLTRQTICLTAYERRLGLDTYSDIEIMSKRKKQKFDIEQKVDNAGDSIKTEEIPSVEEVKLEEHENNSSNEAEQDGTLADAVHDAVNTILSLQQTFDRQNSENSETDDVRENIKPEPKVEVPAETKHISKETLEQIQVIKKGWTETNCLSLTVGEIYLMYGCDSRVILEYSWDDEELCQSEQPKKTAANFLERWQETYEESWGNKQQNLSSSLSKLLSVAKLHYRENTINCPCGHVCNTKTSKNSSSSIGSAKVRKENNVDPCSYKQGENILLTVVSDSPTMQSQITNRFSNEPVQILPRETTFQSPSMQQQLNSIKKLKPKFSNRKGRRPRSKPIVVERKLPLLPNNLSGHQIVRMTIISQEPQIIPIESQTAGVGTQEDGIPKILTDISEENSNISTVPSSPSRILKENDSEWINAEVADYSLSSLLGHLESPVKNPPDQSIGTVNSHMASDLSNEVDAQLQSLLTESSMDFAANFADLAASVVNDKKF